MTTAAFIAYYVLGLCFPYVTGSIVSFVMEVVEIRLDRKEEKKRRRARSPENE
jgi:hypothetical protein